MFTLPRATWQSMLIGIMAHAFESGTLSQGTCNEGSGEVYRYATIPWMAHVTNTWEEDGIMYFQWEHRSDGFGVVYIRRGVASVSIPYGYEYSDYTTYGNRFLGIGPELSTKIEVTFTKI